MSELRAVRVRWHDSVRIYDGWDTVDHYRESDHYEPSECSTLGWLVRDDKHGVIVCLSRSLEAQFVADGMFIPRSAIIGMEDVEVPAP